MSVCNCLLWGLEGALLPTTVLSMTFLTCVSSDGRQQAHQVDVHQSPCWHLELTGRCLGVLVDFVVCVAADTHLGPPAGTSSIGIFSPLSSSQLQWADVSNSRCPVAWSIPTRLESDHQHDWAAPLVSQAKASSCSMDSAVAIGQTSHSSGLSGGEADWYVLHLHSINVVD